ncbi:MAG: hypothetical protein K8H86_05945, partial [Ignavibacteriaceae bacterium]|nr:hypothetical protein [Ignavibacteriaceae bacterium]
MKTTIDEVGKEVSVLIQTHFIPILRDKIFDEETILKSVSDLFLRMAGNISAARYNDEDQKDTAALMEYHAGILEITKSHHLVVSPEDFDVQFKSFKASLDALFERVEETLNVYQKPERFKKLEGDSFQILINKKIKSISYWFTQRPTAFTNVFRKLFKKELKPPKLWKQDIPFRNLCAYYFGEELSKQLMLPLIHTHKGISDAILAQWKALKEAEQEIKKDKSKSVKEFEQSINQLRNKLEALKKTNIEESDAAVSRITESITNAYEIAGTIELTNRHFGESKIKKKHEKLNGACR